MQYSRAEEILSSNAKFEVFYEGKPVWINSLNPANKTAEVTLNNTSQKLDVRVDELVETN